MASIRQSRQVNMEGWHPAPPPGTPQSLPDDADSQRNGRSAFMRSSMPYNATDTDGVQRQFYGGSNAFTSRIFIPPEGVL